MKIIVIGGTGLIGTKVVKNLRDKGHEVVAASPSKGINSVTGEGLAGGARRRTGRCRCRQCAFLRNWIISLRILTP